MSPDKDSISLDELFAAVGVSSSSSSDDASASRRKAEKETTEEDLLGALGISPVRTVPKEAPEPVSVDAAGIDKQDRREEQKNRARQWREELKQAEAQDAEAAPVAFPLPASPVQASITSLPDASGAIRPFASEQGMGRIGTLEPGSGAAPQASQQAAAMPGQAPQSAQMAPAGAMPQQEAQQAGRQMPASQPGASQRPFHPWQPQPGASGQMQPVPAPVTQMPVVQQAPQQASQQIQQQAPQPASQPGANQPPYGQPVAFPAHPQQPSSQLQPLQPLQGTDSAQANEVQQAAPGQMLQPHSFPGMGEVGSLRPIEQQLAHDAAHDQPQGAQDQPPSAQAAAPAFQAAPASTWSSPQSSFQPPQQTSPSVFAPAGEEGAPAERSLAQGVASEQAETVAFGSAQESFAAAAPIASGVMGAASEDLGASAAETGSMPATAQLPVPEGVPTASAEHPSAPFAPEPQAPAPSVQPAITGGLFAQPEPAPLLPAVAPQPVRNEALDDLEKEARSSKAAHIVGGILIAIALICVVVAVCLLTGVVDLSAFNPSKTPVSTQETTQLSGQAAPSATSSGSSSADDPAMTTQSGSKSGEVVYSYVVRGVDGGTHEAIETATFGDDGKLVSSVLEIQSDSQEDSEKLLEQLKQEFGESLTEGTASEDKLICTVVLPRDDLDRDSYTELLSTNAPEFKILSS